VGARPHKARHWRGLLEAAGFDIETEQTTAMRLLDPVQFVRDEGIRNALRFSANDLLRDRRARRRILDMRSVLLRHRAHLAAVCFVARKPVSAG
jgi:citrate lyase beta subunit